MRDWTPVFVLGSHLWDGVPVFHLSSPGRKLDLGNGSRGFEQRTRCGRMLYRAMDNKVTDDRGTGLPWRHAAVIGRLCRRCADSAQFGGA